MITTMPELSRLSSAAAWQAVLDRDQTRDGGFVFAVKTTGVYCRPSCPARRPNRGNVEFFDSGEDARVAGFRACLRCRPDRDRADPLLAAKSILESADGDLVTLDRLGAEVGMSPGHLQRRFKARFGISPREFQAARRSNRLKTALKRSGSVSRATYDAGYGSSSRVYESADARLGMTPSRFAKGGAGLSISYAITDSPLGRLLVAVTERGVSAVLPGRTDAELVGNLEREFPKATISRIDPRADAALGALVSKVVAEVAASAPGLEEVPLDIVGTAFQERVWRALQRIPRGKTRSYGDVARSLGQPLAVRAVASAIARNRLAVLIPCHRVIREDGSLGGYRWGLPTKRRLLDRERS